MAGSSKNTPLAAAIGEGEENRPPHPQRDELVRLLLEPYDIQVVYNIHPTVLDPHVKSQLGAVELSAG